MHCIMHAYIQVRSYHKGDSIIKKGTIGTTMFFIDIGSVRAEIRGQVSYIQSTYERMHKPCSLAMPCTRCTRCCICSSFGEERSLGAACKAIHMMHAALYEYIVGRRAQEWRLFRGDRLRRHLQETAARQVRLGTP